MQLFLVLCASACGSSKTIAYYINIIPENLQCRSLDPCTDTSDCKAGVWNRHCRAAFMKHKIPLVLSSSTSLRLQQLHFGTCMHAVGGSRVLIHNGRSSLFDLCPCITWQRSSGRLAASLSNFTMSVDPALQCVFCKQYLVDNPRQALCGDRLCGNCFSELEQK